MPEQLATSRVEGDDAALIVAREHQARCRAHHAGGAGSGVLELPLSVPGHWINRAKRTIGALRPLGALRRATQVELALAVILLPREIGGAGFACVDEERSERGIVRRWIEVGAAREIRTRRRALFVRPIVGEENRPPIAADFLGPGRVNEGLRDQRLPGGPVDGVEEAVTVGDHHHLARLSVDWHLAENRDVRRVPIPGVVGGELVVPAHLSRVGVERQQGIAVEVVAEPDITVEIWTGVSGSIEHEVRVRIVGAGRPHAGAGRGADVRPGVPSWFPRPRNGHRPPDALAGLHVVGVDETGNQVLPAGDTDDELVLDDERCDRRGVAFLVLDDLGVPQHGAGARVQRDDVGVERGHEEAVAENAKAPVDRPAAHAHVRRELAAIAPERPTGSRVDRPRQVVLARDVEHAVDHQRRRFELAAAGVGLERPLVHQTVDVLRRELRQRAMPSPVVLAAEHQPLIRVLQAVEQLLRRDDRRSRLALCLLGDERRQRRRTECEGRRRCDKCSPHMPPHRVTAAVPRSVLR